jgi:hypothetical protein
MCIVPRVMPTAVHVRSLVAVAAAATALVVAAGAAGAAGRTFSLALVGTHAKAPAKCGAEAQADPYSAVRHGVAFTLVGSVRPAPTTPRWRVHVVVKRCVRGDYTKVWTGMVVGGKGGTFRVAYTPKIAGLLVVKADFGNAPNVSSRKVRLRVS